MTPDPDRRIAGVLIPVFALRSEGDLGIGDTAALRSFIDWAAEAGFALVQLLPINETGGDNSPYNAISSMALDPTTLALTPDTLSDLRAADCEAAMAAVDMAALREGPVQYSLVKPLKLGLLRRAFSNFEKTHLRAGGRSGRVKDFRRFQATQEGWLRSYALFRALMVENSGSEQWDQWPAEQSTAAKAAAWMGKQPAARRDALKREMSFHTYVQWVAYRQWEEVKRYADGRGVALMGDIPLGISYYSADYFASAELFEPGWSGGAPPEPYFKDDAFTQKWGQNWGIPVYNCTKMREDNFAWWRQRVGGVRDLFHVFRIDHILGFFRIYSFPWRPERNAEFLPLSRDEARERTGGLLPQFKPRDDESQPNRELNRREGEELLRMVLEAAGETRLIGEDLGVVPDYVRPALTALGIAGFKIPIWEPDQRTGGLLAGSEYARLSVTTYGTHDHAPLRALWTGWQKAGADHRRELQALADFARIAKEDLDVPYNERVLAKLLEALFRSNSWIAIFMITDLLAREDRFNVPGTAAESNWSRRMHLTVAELRKAPLTAPDVLRALIERCGREVPPANSKA